MIKKFFLLTLSCLAAFSALQAQVKIIAHRGYWKTSGSAQNSLTSFAKADSIGVFGSEFDVWMTKDEKLVVNHDKTFKGINMETGLSSEIRKIHLENGEPIPSLQEYLKFAAGKPKTRIILEMKSLSDLNREDVAVRKIVKILKKQRLLNQTDIIAFSINACLGFKKSIPEARIYYLGGDLPPQKIKELGLAGIDYSVKTLKQRPEWVAESHKLGLEVNVWTVNNEEDMKYFIGLGVDYITTDYPEKLQELVSQK